jgi:hypothetical protein
MKPQHASLTRISRCSCCQSKLSVKNSGSSKHGNAAARGAAKRNLRKELDVIHRNDAAKT